jgi:hypothetical protein
MEFTRTPSAPTHGSSQHDNQLLDHHQLDISAAQENDPENFRLSRFYSDQWIFEIADKKYCRIVIFSRSEGGRLFLNNISFFFFLLNTDSVIPPIIAHPSSSSP